MSIWVGIRALAKSGRDIQDRSMNLKHLLIIAMLLTVGSCIYISQPVLSYGSQETRASYVTPPVQLEAPFLAEWDSYEEGTSGLLNYADLTNSGASETGVVRASIDLRNIFAGDSYVSVVGVLGKEFVPLKTESEDITWHYSWTAGVRARTLAVAPLPARVGATGVVIVTIRDLTTGQLSGLEGRVLLDVNAPDALKSTLKTSLFAAKVFSKLKLFAKDANPALDLLSDIWTVADIVDFFRATPLQFGKEEAAIAVRNVQLVQGHTYRASLLVFGSTSSEAKGDAGAFVEFDLLARLKSISVGGARENIPSVGLFSDNFENGSATGWYAWNSGIRTGTVRDLNANEWTVVTVGTRHWLRYMYSGGSTGHTDGNYFLTAVPVLDLSKDFTLEWRGQYTTYNGAAFGLFYIPDETIYINPYTGKATPPDALRPVQLGEISTEKDLLVLLGNNIPIRHVPPNSPVTVVIKKRGNVFEAYLDGALVDQITATLPVHLSGIYKLAFHARGPWGGMSALYLTTSG